MRPLPLILALFFATSPFAQQQDLIAVFDLKNQGGVTATDIDMVCEAIARHIGRQQEYFLFDRALIPQVLKETGFAVKNDCSERRCLAKMGRLLAAKKVVGGKITRRHKQVMLELFLVDVESSRIDNKVAIRKQTSRKSLLEFHIPDAVRALLSVPHKGQTTETVHKVHKRRGRWWIPFTGLMAIGAAGAGAYLLVDKEEPPADKGINDVPLGDLPIRER